jgi:uncharacterized protein YfaS (alpha-2-macroglobulin family)
MVRIYRPGEILTARGFLTDAEAGIPIKNVPINIEQRSPRTGLYEIITSTTTDSAGNYTMSITLPTEEGSIALRLYFPGTAEYAPDASPGVTITIRKPKASRSTLSLTLE